MKLAHLTFAIALTISTAAQAAKYPPEHSSDPGFFQDSYDQEAMGHNQEALAALDKLSSEKNGSYIALLRKGWLQYCLGKNALAIESYTKAIAMAPKAVEPLLGILLPLIAEKQWAAAERHARGVLKIAPENYLATLRLAYCLYNQNKFPEAQKLYQKLVEAYPSDTEARSGLGWALLKLRRTKDAAAVFRAVLDFAPKNTLAQKGLAATSEN
jgi:tetratricopeptide (TPR) repeat protein